MPVRCHCSVGEVSVTVWCRCGVSAGAGAMPVQCLCGASAGVGAVSLWCRCHCGVIVVLVRCRCGAGADMWPRGCGRAPSGGSHAHTWGASAPTFPVASVSRTPSLQQRTATGSSLVPSTLSAFLPLISVLFYQSRSSAGGIPPAMGPAGAVPSPGEGAADAFPTQSVASPSVSPLPGPVPPEAQDRSRRAGLGAPARFNLCHHLCPVSRGDFAVVSSGTITTPPCPAPHSMGKFF